MALVPYLSESDLSAADRPLLKRPINLFRALANSPGALRSHSVLGEWIRWHCELDPRLRELAILQVGYLTSSRYEFSHHVHIGHQFGVTDDDIDGLIAATAGDEHGLGEVESAVLSAARQLSGGTRVDEETWETLTRHLDNQGLVDLVMVISFYNAVVRILEGLQIDVEPEYQHYLDRFPLPDDRNAGNQRPK
ncbi:carboxymuconolactone decarboxylase family protein [Saccharopolyspora sp. K220]|uniref:carboxymuconolactone decarboxylase family protein n=1 Tax=Saccharopolyspora soli TaxID=2926618 RepID=UPI001F55B8E4|nr:carboxymuconolactone decarboxylase family protein [Saccharopolyspora soli]MCI2419543.1 carboxymuconolactone decarboxylase family protein [Saccharopolyspora soli]